MQGSARKDVVFGAARVYTFTVPVPKWKSWLIMKQIILPLACLLILLPALAAADSQEKKHILIDRRQPGLGP